MFRTAVTNGLLLVIDHVIAMAVPDYNVLKTCHDYEILEMCEYARENNMI